MKPRDWPRHQLIDAEVEGRLLKHPFGSTENEPDPEILVTFLCAVMGWKWHVIEADKTAEGDWRFYGFVQGFADEIGYFALSEINADDLPPLERMTGLSRRLNETKRDAAEKRKVRA